MLPWGMDLSRKPFRDSGKRHIALFELAYQGDFANGAASTGLIFGRCLESPSCVDRLSRRGGEHHRGVRRRRYLAQ